MPAYVIYQGEVFDPERYEEYKRLVTPNIAAAGGRYLVRGGHAEALEVGLPGWTHGRGGVPDDAGGRRIGTGARSTPQSGRFVKMLLERASTS